MMWSKSWSREVREVEERLRSVSVSVGTSEVEVEQIQVEFPPRNDAVSRDGDVRDVDNWSHGGIQTIVTTTSRAYAQ